MREIKFRAWDKKKKEYWTDIVCEMADNDLYEDETETETGELSMWTVAFMMRKGDDSRFSFEQYTGLKDKNRDNAEVYQGDIYKWCGLTFPITIDDYHGYRFMFGEDQLCRAFIENGEYVGNIHEQENKS